MKTTTLNQIKYHGPCELGWKKLLSGLGKSAADDTPLPYAEILRINGVDDALWSTVRCAHLRDVIDLACRYAESVAHLTTDPRAAEAVRVARGVIAGTHARAEAEETARVSWHGAEATKAAWATWAASWAAWAAARRSLSPFGWAMERIMGASARAADDLTLRERVFAEWAAAPSLAPSDD